MPLYCKKYTHTGADYLYKIIFRLSVPIISVYDLPPIFSPDWILVVQYMHFFKRFSSCIGHCFFLVVFHVKRVAQVYLYHSVSLGHHSRWLGCPLRDILLCDLIGKCMVRLKPTLFFFPLF